MKKKLLLAIALASLVSSAMAQSAFEGFYGQVAAGYENNSVDSVSSRSSGINNPLNNPSASNANGQVNIGLGYNTAVSQKWLLGLGAEYSTMSSTSNSSQVTSISCGGNCGQYNQYKISNRYSIFLTPTYALEKNSAVYAKVGYTNQKIQATIIETTAFDANNNAKFSSTTGGYVLGLGYKQIIQGGLYGFVEANYYKYSGANLNGRLPMGEVVTGYNPTSSAYNALVGVGYKF
jgi:opacity protein-like surface antigen